MSIVDSLYRAARDTIGGGFGGLMAVWVSSPMTEASFTILAIGAVFGWALVLLGFDRLREKEKRLKKNRRKRSDSTEEEYKGHWPPNRAS